MESWTLQCGTSSSNLKTMPCPSSLTWGKVMVSEDDAGRVQQSALMYVKKITDKVTLSLEWQGISASDVATILKAFDNEYIYVKYLDPRTNSSRTMQAYPGDMSAPVYCYWSNGVMYQNVSFDVIER